MKKTITTKLTPREYRHLLRQRGRLRLRKIDNSPMTPRARYWANWHNIRDEWAYLVHVGWQGRSVRQANRLRLEKMRNLRLNESL